VPEEIVLQLSHKDVYLDYFKYSKQEVLSLRGGDELTYNAPYLCSAPTGQAIARLSQGMLDKLVKWEAKGYHVATASVRFIVAWKSKNAAKEEKELAVLLADLMLRKN
jgi:ATP-dependent DNA helicase RecQ